LCRNCKRESFSLRRHKQRGDPR